MVSCSDFARYIFEANRWVYVNDAADSSVTWTTYHNVALYWLDSTWSVAQVVGGGYRYKGCVSEVYINTDTAIDLSVEGNRRKFISATTHPVDLGADGSTPTSSQPAFYLKYPYTGFHTNAGYAGDFTVEGGGMESCLRHETVLSISPFGLVCVSRDTTYYIDYSEGSDTNNGTATNTAWQRAPGMVGFTGTYSATTNDAFVFRGNVTWPAACFPWHPFSVVLAGATNSRDTLEFQVTGSLTHGAAQCLILKTLANLVQFTERNIKSTSRRTGSL